MEDLSTCGVTFVRAWRHLSAIIWLETEEADSNPQISPVLYIAARCFVFNSISASLKAQLPCRTQSEMREKAYTTQDWAEAKCFTLYNKFMGHKSVIKL